jgi:hypothetical protein
MNLNLGIPELIVVLVILLFVLVVWGQIFHKAGHSRWLALLVCVPLANLIVILWFAFSKWSLQSEIERLRMSQSHDSPPGMKP